MEYLDDVIFHASINSEEDTSQTSGKFIDTNRILNKIEHDRVTPSTPEVNTSTNKASESSRLQMPQQRSDDPRRGGKVSIEVREAWNTDPRKTNECIK